MVHQHPQTAHQGDVHFDFFFVCFWCVCVGGGGLCKSPPSVRVVRAGFDRSCNLYEGNRFVIVAIKVKSHDLWFP